MAMTRAQLALFAGLGSLALLLGAFAFQHLGGLAPCKMCIWQRYPHVIAVAVGAIAFFLPLVWIVAFGALAALTTAGVGLYHVGVEQRWWEGPSTCSSGGIGGISAEDLMAQIMSAPLVRCDEIAWQFAGLSMAGWNALLSFGLAGLWIYAIKAGSAGGRL